MWKAYLGSWKSKRITHGFLVDVATVGVLTAILFIFNRILTAIVGPLAQFGSEEQIQQALLSASPEEAQALFASLQSFMYVFLIGIMIVIPVSLFLYSYSRSYLWGKLLHKKTKFWRWNALMLTLIIIGAMYTLAASLLNLILTLILSSFLTPSLLIVAQSIISSFFIVLFIMLLFLVFKEFTHRYKVFESVGNAIQHFKKYSGRTFGIAILTLLVIQVVLSLIQRFFMFNQEILMLLGLLVFIFYAAWLRSYLVGHR